MRICNEEGCSNQARISRTTYDPKCKFCYNLIYTYGITHKIKTAMFKDQDGVCKICKKEQDYSKICVDHDHSTEKVRGLLCQSCNRGLGQFLDNVQSLKSAIKYLEEE